MKSWVVVTLLLLSIITSKGASSVMVNTGSSTAGQVPVFTGTDGAGMQPSSSITVSGTNFSTSGNITANGVTITNSLKILNATSGKPARIGSDQTVTNGVIDLSTEDVTGTLPGASVGTGIDAGNITSGTLPNARLSAVPNSALANSAVTVTGAANQISVSGSPVSLGGTVTITTPQDIGTGSSPMFAGISITGTNATFNSAVATNGITVGNAQWYKSISSAGGSSNMWKVNASNYLEFGTPIYRDDNGSFPDRKSWVNMFRQFTTVPVTGSRDAVTDLRFQTRGAGDVNSGRVGMRVTGGDRSDVVNRTITGASNNGSGLIRITTSSSFAWVTGDRISVYGVTGTTEANGVWVITRIDSTTFDLQGSTFSNAWISGGIATNRGLFYAITGTVEPLVDRGGLTGTAQFGDDVACFVGINTGTAIGTDAYYLGHNSSFGTNAEWATSFTMSATALYGIRMNGQYTSNILDFSSGSVSSGEAIKFGSGQRINVNGTLGTVGNDFSQDGTDMLWSEPQNLVRKYDELMNATAGELGWSTLVSGAGAAWVAGVGTAQRPGINQFQSGTATNSMSGMRPNGNSILLGGGRNIFKTAVRVPTASDGTDTFTVMVGFGDFPASTGEATDGAYFVYSSSPTYYVTNTSVGSWVGKTSNNTARSETAPSAALVANQWYTLTVDVNAAGTSVSFYIDGTLLGALTTNIPTGAGRNTVFGYKIEKQAGTNSRNLDADFAWWYFKPTTAR